MSTLITSAAPLSLPRPPEKYDAQDQREMRRLVGKALQASTSSTVWLPWYDALDPIGGTADDATGIQTQIDAAWAAGGGIVQLRSGVYNISSIKQRDRVRIRGTGVGSTTLKVLTGASSAGAILLDTGPVRDTELSGFTLQGVGNTGQHGIFYDATATVFGGVLQGGLWYSRFRDLFVDGFDGDSVWLKGGGNLGGDPAAFQEPHQFLKFERVYVSHGNIAASIGLSTRALRLSGQVGQVGFDEDCEFDYQAGAVQGVAGVNILIERDVDIGGTNRSDMAPYDITFRGVTCQGRARGVTIERGANIRFIGGHFENLNEGILNSVSAQATLVDGVDFANVGYTGTGVGWGVKNTGGVVTAAGCNFYSSTAPTATETHYISASNNPIYVYGTHYDATGIRTSGLTRSVFAAAATLDINSHKMVWVNGPSATAITTLTENHAPGTLVTLVANAGHVILGSGGNLDVAPFEFPLRIEATCKAMLQKTDISGGGPAWKLVALSGARGHIRQVAVFVNHAASPYSVDTKDGAVRVDATAGDVNVILPSVNDTGSGFRVLVRRIDGTANNVFVNGSTTPENPNGLATNSTKLSANQALEFERNATVGIDGWDIVAEYKGSASTSTFSLLSTGSLTLTGTGEIITATGATTAAKAFRIANTGGEFYVGVESSAAGSFFPGSSAYNSVLYSNGKPLQIITNGVGGLEVTLNNGATFEHQATIKGGAVITDVSSVVVFLNTTTGATADNAQLIFQRGGTIKWRFGNNIGGGNIDLLDVYSDVLGAVVASFSTTGTATFSYLMAIRPNTGGYALLLQDSVSNTGINLKPSTSGDSAFIDNTRVGSIMSFRVSNVAAADKTPLSLTGQGNVVMAILPTSSAGLAAGTLWKNGTVVNII